eukprot:CAMPEP_0204018634 /NCGR_PEP_ID=MMETSP0360-20130528/28205_1 /ASSEMBLY_ACC=CAM_ASM_000342 /TAXON_ID=268821 /ORGANISM="Scrippsiella Hangoei, Strain SHTV-5" /LENGTH=39 /DNA_ID= /DNA_START= /DNA_END= /DNA_ORIENTATION=
MTWTAMIKIHISMVTTAEARFESICVGKNRVCSRNVKQW